MTRFKLSDAFTGFEIIPICDKCSKMKSPKLKITESGDKMCQHIIQTIGEFGIKTWKLKD